MRILITGGTGFLGHELVKQLYDSCERIVIYSRSESKQAEMKMTYPEGSSDNDNKMRYFIGDVRELSRLITAMHGCTHVIHAAALKRVEVCARDVYECAATNIYGSRYVAEAAYQCGVRKAMLISTDKAVEPTTTYGKSKAMAEDIFIQANNYSPDSTKYSVVRYANVEGSTGSLMTIWDKQRKAGQPITITHRDMTRMWLTVEDAARFTIGCLLDMQGGEVFLPECARRSILSMAREYIMSLCDAGVFWDSPANLKEIGLRPAEKLHEVLISEADARDCWYEADRERYVIYPAHHEWGNFKKRGVKMPDTFRMCSIPSASPETRQPYALSHP